MAALLNLTNEHDRHIDQRLRENMIVWFNTVRPDGSPHSVAVWFLWDGETFLIFSKPDNQKIRNLKNNPRVLLAVDNTHGGSDPITIAGTATLLQPGEVDPTLESYVKKYGKGIKDIGLTPETMAAAYSQAIRIIPTRVV